MSETSDAPSQDIVARAGRYYRNARYVICAMALGAGLWFAYDGFYNWPKQKVEFDALPDAKKAEAHQPENDRSILINKLLAIGLIPLAPVLLCFFLYRSRGEYRLSGTTLYVPGHPPVPFENITAIDKTKWKRKGIAYVDYRPDGANSDSRLTIDDFVYDQVPTDEIVDQLDKWLNPEGTEEAESENAQGSDEEASEGEVDSENIEEQERE